jgi:hypothetical protein
MAGFVQALPAKGDCFYGHSRLTERIVRSRDWIWICSPRRLGKTSLLYRLAEMLENAGHLVFALDLALFHGEPLSGRLLFTEFFKEHRRTSFEPRKIPLEEFEDLEAAAAFEKLVHRLSEKGGSVHVDFLWDEAEQLLNTQKVDPHFLPRLNARLRRLERFRFVFAASQSLSELLETARDFSLHWIPLGGLDDDASAALLQRQKTGGWISPMPEEMIRQAVEWCGGHPFMLQSLGAELSRQTHDEGRLVDGKLLHDCWMTVIQNPTLRDTVADDFAKLTPAQQQLLRLACQRPAGLSRATIAKHSDLSPQQVEDSLAFLKSYGYLAETDKVHLRFKVYKDLLPVEGSQRALSPQHVQQIRRTVFVSYSHEDKQLYEQLRRFLVPILAGRELEVWDDSRISPGDRWKEEIASALSRAQVGVLLVSSSFLASPFIRSTEVPVLLAKAHQKGGRILCLHVGSSLFDRATWNVEGRNVSLADFQALNPADKPLDSLPRIKRDQVLASSANAILNCLLGDPLSVHLA